MIPRGDTTAAQLLADAGAAARALRTRRSARQHRLHPLWEDCGNPNVLAMFSCRLRAEHR